jgi:hypothetical protein
MRRRTLLTLAGSAAVTATAAVSAAVAAGGPVAASTTQRSAPTVEHVLTLHEKAAGPAVDRGPLLIQADDGYQGRTQVSADVVDCHFGQTAASCQFALAVGPGLLYGHFTETPGNKISGVVRGGTGALEHARGTITGSSVITVRYRT